MAAGEAGTAAGIPCSGQPRHAPAGPIAMPPRGGHPAGKQDDTPPRTFRHRFGPGTMRPRRRRHPEPAPHGSVPARPTDGRKPSPPGPCRWLPRRHRRRGATVHRQGRVGRSEMSDPAGGQGRPSLPEAGQGRFLSRGIVGRMGIPASERKADADAASPRPLTGPPPMKTYITGPPSSRCSSQARRRGMAASPATPPRSAAARVSSGSPATRPSPSRNCAA